MGDPALATPIQTTELTDFNAILEPIRKQYDLPALAGAVVKSTGLVGAGAVGVRRYGSKVPVTRNDQFHLGSDTKAMTATLVALLVEKGRLTWETTLAEAIPDMANRMALAYRKVTLEQLMAHQSGMSDESWPKGQTFQSLHDLPGTPRAQRLAYIKMILAEPPVVAPKTKFLYSNRNFAVAGFIAEQVTNIAWEELIRQQLFTPLKMTTAGFGGMGTPGKLDQPLQHHDRRHPIEPGKYSDNPEVIGPAGTVHCSIEDWAKFIALHLQGEQGKDGLLKAATLKRLHEPHYGDYTFGWIVAQRPWGGGKVLTHAGCNNQNYAVVWMAPLRDFAVLAMTNLGTDPASQACDDVAGALIGWTLKQKS